MYVQAFEKVAKWRIIRTKATHQEIELKIHENKTVIARFHTRNDEVIDMHTCVQTVIWGEQY